MDHLRHQKYKNIQLEINFKTINISINDMDKLKNRKKRTFTKNTWYDWYDWLVNYIPEPIKNRGQVRDQIMSLFKTKNYIILKCIKTVYGGGKSNVNKTQLKL